MGYNSYYLYCKMIQIGDQPPVPFYPETYSVSGDSENPMPLVLKEEDSVECGYTDIVYRWHQLPITASSECQEGTKYYVDIYQVSNDGGLSWEDVVPTTTRRGVVYEYNSPDCIEYRWTELPISTDYICDECPPVQPIYRTLTSATTCVGYDKYTLEEYQVSYDSGVTWTTTGTSATTLVEADSPDCGYVPPTPTFEGKWKATYTGGSVTSAECDSSSAITNGEINRTGLTSVLVGDCVISIGNHAFNSFSSLTSVIIGSGVTSIGDTAFSSCISLTSVTIPNSVTTISGHAFANCSSLPSITIPDSVTSIGGSTFLNCSGLTSVTIPSGVTSIGDYTFQYCSGLTSVTIGSGVTTIGIQAFRYCSSLTSVTIPDSVTSIGDYAFNYCESLTSITIGNSVTSIGNAAFRHCESLTSVTVLATTPPTIGAYVFNNTNDCPIYVPSASVNAYKTANYWSNYSSRFQAIP